MDDHLIKFDIDYGKLFLHKQDKYYKENFAKGKYKDLEYLKCLQDHIIPNDRNILEIGSHTGCSTMLYSKFLGLENTVYAFEPQKELFEILNRNIKVNGLGKRIKAFNSAIFCKSGLVCLDADIIEGDKREAIEAEGQTVNYGAACLGKGGEMVTCLKLDDIELDNIGFIHCDVPGADPFIFSTGKEFIKKHRPFILFKDYYLGDHYLYYNNIKLAYRDFVPNSLFLVRDYCVNELGYHLVFNYNKSGVDSLLMPYKYTNWNNYKRDEIDAFDYRVLATYKTPFPLVRVGPKGDGGYVIVDGLEYDLFLTCGISKGILFEEGLLDMCQMPCHVFDGTIRTFPQHKNAMKWIKKNIGYSNTLKTTNLSEYVKLGSKIFLKMVMEGSEFNWLDFVSKENLERIGQIVLEVHWPFDKYRMSMLQKLNETHYIVHIHGNNFCDRDIPKGMPSGRSYDGLVRIKRGDLREIVLPEVMEITYLNKSFLHSSLVRKKEIQFPTSLDFPNNADVADIEFSIPVE